jgi:NAD(P)H-dependent FMN reductase
MLWHAINSGRNFVGVIKNSHIMKKIIAFAGSNSRNSINKQLIGYTSSLLEGVSVTLLDMNDFDLPLFSVDVEKDSGFPEKALSFNKHLEECDGILISLAEHNGSYTAVFKNLFDWLSRIDVETWKGKPMLLMATSPGGRGGKSVLEAAKIRFPKHKAKIITTFSLPHFADNFTNGKVVNASLNGELEQKLNEFVKIMKGE